MDSNDKKQIIDSIIKVKSCDANYCEYKNCDFESICFNWSDKFLTQEEIINKVKKEKLKILLGEIK